MLIGSIVLCKCNNYVNVIVNMLIGSIVLCKCNNYVNVIVNMLVGSIVLCKCNSEYVNWEYSTDDLIVEQLWDGLYANLHSSNAVLPKTDVISNGRPVK